MIAFRARLSSRHSHLEAIANDDVGVNVEGTPAEVVVGDGPDTEPEERVICDGGVAGEFEESPTLPGVDDNS